MDGNVFVMKCGICSFYFIKSKSTEIDYINYYSTHNNYAGSASIYKDKDFQTAQFLTKNLDPSVKTIIDYGSGSGGVSKLLSSKYDVTEYDVGQDIPTSEYDCLVLSHVLEHIYNPSHFITEIDRYVRHDGFMYIEIPDATRYDKMGKTPILQEINIEHINFFSPYSLSKLMLQCGYTPVYIHKGSFALHENEYQAIRAIFQKNRGNSSVERYIEEGVCDLEKMKNSLPVLNGRVFLYGCGQLLYKIISYLKEKHTIEAIIDDNPNFHEKTLSSLPIVPLSLIKDSLTPLDTVVITVGKLYTAIIQERLKEVCSDLRIVTI